VYRKSGSWRNFHSDSALVFGENGRRYIIVVLLEDARGGEICSKFITQAERALGLDKDLVIPPLEPFTGPVLSPDKE